MFEEHLKFYQDFPTPGITFVDIIPYLQNREVFKGVTAEVARHITAPSVACPEARAFLFASPLLIADNCDVDNIILFRKRGKLPYTGDDLKTIEIMKEYGSDKLIYRNSDIAAGRAEDGIIHVSIVDDVLATGGTAEGVAKALEATKLTIDGKEYGVKVNEFIFIVELDGLNGRDRLAEIAPVYSIARI